MKSKFIRSIATVATSILVSAVLLPTGANATTKSASLDMTSMTMPVISTVQSGDVISLKISGLGSQGVYVSVCRGDVTSATKSTLCDPDQSHMAWITANGGQGSASGASGGNITVATTFSTVNCLVDSCSLYVRGDHNNTTAYQLTRKIPLSFKVGGGVRFADSVTGTAGGMTMTPNVPHNLTYATPIRFSLKSTSGLRITLSSLTPDCSVNGTVVTALAGNTVCAIAATTLGNTRYSPLSVNFPFYTFAKAQTIGIKWPVRTSVKVGQSLVVRVVTSNVKQAVTVASSTPTICSVTTASDKWTVKMLRAGSCALSAAASADATSSARWNSVQIGKDYLVVS